jgi:hypothetical protein
MRRPSGMWFGEKISDPWMYGTIVLLFSVIALLACYISARLRNRELAETTAEARFQLINGQ